MEHPASPTDSPSSNAGSRASTPATPVARAPTSHAPIERRVLPARLRRVSSLLAGSAIDEDFLNGMDKADAPVLPLNTPVILSSYGDWPASFTAPDADDLANGISFFSSAELARACRAREVIETPDFRARDDSEVLGKTRGSRVEEDTSDAAYERRHQRPDKLEKKQRRLEKERLVKEKHKLEERIEQLRVADARLLMPILVAREKREGSAVSFSSRGMEATFGLGRANMSSEASANLQRLEALRQDLLGEANETLRRYEALLPEEAAAAAATSERRKKDEESAAEESDSTSGAAAQRRKEAVHRRAKEIRRAPAAPRSRLSDSAISSREARAGRRSGRLVSAPSSAPSTPRERPARSAAAAAPRSKKSPTPKPTVVPKGVSIHAEAKHINIHARTSGGRFAPKAALATGKAKDALQPRARRADGSLLSKAATQRILEAQKERERQQSRLSSELTSPSTSTASPASQRPSRHAESSTSAQKRLKSDSGEALEGEKKPKRLRLVLGSKGRGEARREEREGDDEDDDDEERGAANAPPALTKEQAEAMLAAAMASDAGDADVSMSDASGAVKREGGGDA